MLLDRVSLLSMAALDASPKMHFLHAAISTPCRLSNVSTWSFLTHTRKLSAISSLTFANCRLTCPKTRLIVASQLPLIDANTADCVCTRLLVDALSDALHDADALMASRS